MSEVYTGLTAGGKEWTPQFIQSINHDTCIGCGRCFKACNRNVLQLVGLDEDGEIIDAFDDDVERKVMSIIDASDCVGCKACDKACGKGVISHSPQAVAV